MSVTSLKLSVTLEMKLSVAKMDVVMKERLCDWIFCIWKVGIKHRKNGSGIINF